MWFFFSNASSHFIASKENMTEMVSQIKKTQMLVMTAQKEFSIIRHSKARFLVGLKKYKKAKKSILRYRKYVGQIEVTADLKRKIKQLFQVYLFRLTRLYG